MIQHANQKLNAHFQCKCCRALNWTNAKRTLLSYLKMDTDSIINPMQQFQCNFVLGKIAEKQNPMLIRDALQHYLYAELQLFDREDDVNLMQMKIEISFRITASIYKYILRTENVIEERVLTQLMLVLKRNRSRIFSDCQLASRSNTTEIIDENANNVDVQHQSQVSVCV